MKKIIVSILLLVTMMANILALASCGGGGGGAGGGGGQTFLPPPVVEIPDTGYDGSKVTVTFYHTMGENLRNVLDKYIEKFNLIYPNITIDHNQVGNYDKVRETISTELAVGGGPNIAYCYPDHVALYRRANKVVALDDLIASQAPDGAGGIIGMTDKEKANFIDGYWNEGYQFDDGTKMYTLPFSKSTEVLYYNKTFFDACNAIYSSDIELNFSGKPTPVYELAFEMNENGSYKLDGSGNKIPVYEKNDKGEFVLDKDKNKIQMSIIAYERNEDTSYKLDADGNKIAKTNPNPHKGDANYLISVPTTWDDMEETLRKIKAIDPTSIPLGYDSESNWFITMCEQYGSGYTSATGEKFLFNNDTNKSFIKRFNTWFRNEWVTTQEIFGAYTSGLFTVTAAGAQKSYMSIGSSAGATHQRPTAGADGSFPFEVGITSIPQLKEEGKDGYEPKVISQGPSICVFDKGNDMQTIAAWLFVKYLTTSVEFQADFSIASGYVPVLENVMENEAYNEFVNGYKGYSNISVNKSGKVIADFTKLRDLAEDALSVYTYDETAGTLSITVGDDLNVLNVEKTEGADTVKIYVGNADSKQYLTGKVDKGAYVFSDKVADAQEFCLESCEGGYRFYMIVGGADGGAYISALSAKVCLEQADYYYTSPAFVGSSAARDEVGVLLRKCIAYKGGDLDAYIDKAFKDAISSCKYMAR